MRVLCIDDKHFIGLEHPKEGEAYVVVRELTECPCGCGAPCKHCYELEEFVYPGSLIIGWSVEYFIPLQDDEGATNEEIQEEKNSYKGHTVFGNPGELVLGGSYK